MASYSAGEYNRFFIGGENQNNKLKITENLSFPTFLR